MTAPIDLAAYLRVQRFVEQFDPGEVDSLPEVRLQGSFAYAVLRGVRRYRP